MPERGIKIDYSGPFPVPSDWRWISLGDIAAVTGGKFFDVADEGDRPVLFQGCVRDCCIDYSACKFLADSGPIKSRIDPSLKDGDVVLNSMGYTTLGRSAVYRERDNPYGTMLADSHLIVINGTIEAQEALIRNYCRYYYDKYSSETEEEEEDEDEEDGPTEVAYTEVDRVIRNMAGLDEPSETSKEKYEKTCAWVDGFEDFEEFNDHVLELVDIESRDLDEIDFDGTLGFEDWLRETFDDVNNGRNPGCGIADEIVIEIGIEDIDLHLPSFVGDVIDTKGLDSSARMDLQEFMTSESTVCILMGSINNSPSQAIKSLVKRAFLGEEYIHFSMKTLMYVRATEKDLGNVNEAEGDPELGKEKKLGEIERKVQTEKMLLSSGNVSFVDPHSPFEYRSYMFKDKDGKPKKKVDITGYSDFMAELFREQIENSISTAIGDLRRSLEAESDVVRENVEALMALEEDYENTCGAEELDAIRLDVGMLAEDLDTVVDSRKIVDLLVDSTVFQIHWRSLRKMNSEYGAYGGYGGRTDTYTQIYQAGREVFRLYAGPLATAIRGVFAEHVKDDDVRAVTDSYLINLDNILLAETANTGKRFEIWALERGFYPRSDENRFWVKVNGLRGKGYRQRVGDQYENQIELFEDDLKDIVVDELRRVISKLVEPMPEY